MYMLSSQICETNLTFTTVTIKTGNEIRCSILRFIFDILYNTCTMTVVETTEKELNLQLGKIDGY